MTFAFTEKDYGDALAFVRGRFPYADAEDVVADAWLRCFEMDELYEGVDPRGLLMRTCRLVALGEVRRHKTQKRWLPELQHAIETQAMPPLLAPSKEMARRKRAAQKEMERYRTDPEYRARKLARGRASRARAAARKVSAQRQTP